MQSRLGVVVTRSVLLAGLGAFVALSNWQPLDAQSGSAPGGFLEHASSTTYRTPPTAAEMAQFVPASRGRFYFPAPYNTEAYRLTVPADCGGGDCIEHTGYSDWRNINHHVGQPELRVFLSLEGVTSYSGPHLFTINKTTGVVTKSAPLFPPSNPLSYSRAEGWYWSARHPDVLYTHTGSRLIRVNVATGGQEVVLDLNQHPYLFPEGSRWRVWSPHSSDTDDVHVGTVKIDGEPYSDIGCYVFKASTNEWRFFPSQVDCFVDKSGRYVGLFDNVDGQYSVDARMVDTLTWTIGPPLLDQYGAPGHMDYGHGFLIGEDNWGPAAQALRLWDLNQPWTAPGQGRIIHSMTRWGNSYVQPAFGNSVPTSVKPIEQQYMCSQTTFDTPPSPPVPREREVVCFRLDGSQQMLVVAPTMVDLTAPGGGITYNKIAKGNVDTSGEYYVWTANMGGNRLDAFLVRIPHQLLNGGGSGDTAPPAVALTAPANGAWVNGASVALSANAVDNVGVAGVTFRIDNAPIAAEDTVAPYSVPWNSTAVINGNYTLTATARDAAGNVTTAAPFVITVNNATGSDVTPPSAPSGLSANAMSSSQIRLVWTASTDNVGVTGYRIYRGATPVGTSATTSYVDSNLSASTAYSYTVRAYDAANNLSAASAAALATTSAPTSNPANLVAAFGFNEATGSLTTDSSPLQSIGTLTNATWGSGQLGTGLSVTGSGYVDVPDLNSLTPGVNATFETWVYLNAAPAEPVSLLNKWNQSVDDEYMLALTPNRNVLFAWKTTAGTTWGTNSFNQATSAGQVPVGAWTHVAVVRAGAVLHFYINGGLSSSISAMDANPFRNGINSLRIGGQARGANRLLNGRMDSTRIYNRALTTGEVQADMTIPVDSPTILTGGGQPVVWTNMVNTSAWAATLRKTGGCSGCADAAALSTQHIASGSGALEVIVSKKSSETWVGLSAGNSGSSGTELRYGFRIITGVAEVREFGTLQTNTTALAGDVLRIAIAGGVVRYAKNGVVFYTSSTPVSYPLFGDASLLDIGSEIANAMITIGASSAPTLVRGPAQYNRTSRQTLASAASGGGGTGTHGSGGVIPGARAATAKIPPAVAGPLPHAGPFVGREPVDSQAIAKWAASVLGEAGDLPGALRLYAVSASGEVTQIGSASADDLGPGRTAYTVTLARLLPGAYQIVAIAGDGEPRQLGMLGVVIGAQ